MTLTVLPMLGIRPPSNQRVERQNLAPQSSGRTNLQKHKIPESDSPRRATHSRVHRSLVLCVLLLLAWRHPVRLATRGGAGCCSQPWAYPNVVFRNLCPSLFLSLSLCKTCFCFHSTLEFFSVWSQDPAGHGVHRGPMSPMVMQYASYLLLNPTC